MSLDPDWTDQARCAGADTSLFFDTLPNHREPKRDGWIWIAERFCSKCPVRRECLADSMTAEQGAVEQRRYGLFAGLPPSHRAFLAEDDSRWHCPDCGEVLDPAGFQIGRGWCDDCGWRGEIPRLRGNVWRQRHETLAQSIATWLLDTDQQVGSRMPGLARMATQFKSGRGDVAYIYEHFESAGLLRRSGIVYVIHAERPSWERWRASARFVVDA